MTRTDWYPRAVFLGLGTLLALSCGGGSSPPSSARPAATTPVSGPSAVGGVGAASCPFGKGTVETACTQGKSGLLLADVDAAIEQVAQQRPGVLDVNNQASPNSGQYKILDPKAFIDGVAANLRAAGNCAQADYDFPLQRINVKNGNDYSEDYDLVLSSGYVRRGPKSYRQTCTPAAFPVDPDPSWPPPGSGCGKPYPPHLDYFNAKINLKNPQFYTLDSTPIVAGDLEYCTMIGYTDGRSDCPLRTPDDPERVPCENWMVGKAKDTGRYGPTWTLDGNLCLGLAVNGCENHPENQYGLLAGAQGKYRMCAQNGACGKVVVER
jgi:hypothetical protein